MKKSDKNKTIILGVGNIGRQDDGLGWLFLDFLKKQDLLNADIEYRYQLQVEDAELASNYDTVIFVDATKEDTDLGYYFKECESTDKYGFTTHALPPETIVYLVNNLYQKNPETYTLAIQGYKWNLQHGLSRKASKNLEKATRFFTEKIPTTI